MTMWFLSDTGKQYLKAKSTYLDTVKIDYHPQDTFYHSIGLTNLEVILKRDYAIEGFVSDRYLHKYFADNKKKYRLEYSGYPRIPDMEFSIDGNKYAFELELSKKSRYRYFKMFHFYRDFERYDQVIWVCKDKKMLNYVLKRYLRCLSDSIVRVSKDNEVGLKKIERSKSIHLFATYAEFVKKGMKSLKPLSDYLPGEIPQEKKERIRTNMTELKRTLVT
ncbi:MAG: hypothetical protein HRT90_02105 [Candidatus Margulisbacteria bacterium]|nr:hypothetical protein [Candidatus Margulisiibacteriota bacterium]